MVVVVPSADGHVGMVVVERGDDRVILNEAYATSRVTSDGQIHLEKLEPKEAEAQVVASTSGAASEGQRPELGRRLEERRRREVADIVVIGHTDRVGNEQANDELSLARAERVKAEFVAQGIASAERIRAAGKREL